MVQINFARKEINCKIVFYGPGMSGKTTNLEIIHKKTPGENKGDLTCIATEGDRTLFFDFMPLNLGNIMGMNTKFQLYTVPGQVYYNSTRKLVLRGADGVIFIADSAPDKMDENLESIRNLEENLREYGRDINDIPLVIQYNKRDLPNAVEMSQLEEKLNPRKGPAFEAVATTGEGVFTTLKALAGLVIENLNRTTRKETRTRSAEAPETEQATPGPADRVSRDGGRAAVERGVPSNRLSASAAAVSAEERTTLAASRAGVAAARIRSAPNSPPASSRASSPPPEAPRSRSTAAKPKVVEPPEPPASSSGSRRGITLLLILLGTVAAAAIVFFVSRG